MHLFLMLSISAHTISFFSSSFPLFPIKSVHPFGYRPLIISVIEISNGHRSAVLSSLFFVLSPFFSFWTFFSSCSKSSLMVFIADLLSSHCQICSKSSSVDLHLQHLRFSSYISGCLFFNCT